MEQDKIISMEQMRKILHISKRKAAWMLQNGIIPCENRGRATHTYFIRMEDVEKYMAKSWQQKRKELPLGAFNAKPTKIELHPECYLKLRGAKRENFIEYLENAMIYEPDSLSIDEAASIIGYHRQTVYSHAAKGDITAVRLHGKYIIPKSELIQYLATDKAFKIQRKSQWHLEIVVGFAESEIDNH